MRRRINEKTYEITVDIRKLSRNLFILLEAKPPDRYEIPIEKIHPERDRISNENPRIKAKKEEINIKIMIIRSSIYNFKELHL